MLHDAVLTRAILQCPGAHGDLSVATHRPGTGRRTNIGHRNTRRGVRDTGAKRCDKGSAGLMEMSWSRVPDLRARRAPPNRTAASRPPEPGQHCHPASRRRARGIQAFPAASQGIVSRGIQVQAVGKRRPRLRVGEAAWTEVPHSQAVGWAPAAPRRVHLPPH